MTHLLHYTTQGCNLSDFARSACHANLYSDGYISTLAHINGVTPERRYSAGSPIILPKDTETQNNQPAISSIPQCNRREHQRLAYLSHTLGGAGLMAVSDLVWQFTRDNSTSFAGGAGASMAKTSNFILDSIDNYQRELVQYENLRNHRAAPASLRRQERQLRRSFNHMNQVLNNKGQHFLHKHAFATREIRNLNGRIARESIPITQHHYVKKLSNLAKIGKVAGPGLILLDGFLRYDKVSEMYRENHPQWQRQAFVESTSFTAGVAAAGAIASLVLLMTPGGLLLAVLAGGSAAVGFDHIARGAAGKLFDRNFRQ